MCVARAGWWVRGWSRLRSRNTRVRRRLWNARARFRAAMAETQMEFDLVLDLPICSEKKAINPRAEHGTEGAG